MSVENPIPLDKKSEHASQWFDHHGIVAFTDAQTINFFHQANEKFIKWPFNDSLLAPVTDLDQVQENLYAAGGERGGTKDRFGVWYAPNRYEMKYLYGNFDYPALIRDKHFKSPQEMFDQFVASTLPYSEKAFQQYCIRALFKIFSQPGRSIPEMNGNGIDIQPSVQVKGSVVPDMEKILVGEEYITAFQRAGIKIDKETFRVIMNDVMAVLFALKNAKLSLVWGTGINAGVVGYLDGNRLSCLSSEFADLPIFPLSIKENELNQPPYGIPGIHRAEMIAGGGSMGQLLENVIIGLAREGILPFSANLPMDSSHISAILSDHRQSLLHACKGFDEKDDVSWNILREFARRQFHRAAPVVAVGLAGLYYRFPKSFAQMDTIHCAFEGSTLEHIPGLKHEVQRLFYLLTERKLSLDKVRGADGGAFVLGREFAKRNSHRVF